MQKGSKRARFSKQTILAVLALVAAGGGYAGYTVLKSDAGFDTRMHTVVRVVDGDTVELEDHTKVRLLGINAPEKGECYFEESKAALEELAEGKDVFIQKDITAKDRYGRLLRYLVIAADHPEVDNVFVNDQLVRRGAAFTEAISPDTKYRDLFATSQRKAREGEKGLWGACPDASGESDDLREIDSAAPSPSCTIKGNISEKGYGKNYFMEGCPDYNRIKVDIRKGEAWFCSESAAQKAGFTRSASCTNSF